MLGATKPPELLPLAREFLWRSGLLMEKVFASLWRQVGMKTLLSRSEPWRFGGAIALVLDVLIRQRFGKKMLGVSSHFEHTMAPPADRLSGRRHVVAQQPDLWAEKRLCRIGRAVLYDQCLRVSIEWLLCAHRKGFDDWFRQRDAHQIERDTLDSWRSSGETWATRFARQAFYGN